MLDLTVVDLDEIAIVLADQDNYQHRWLIHRPTGEILFSAAAIPASTATTPVGLDELDPDLLGIGPLPSHVWYQDMVDFAELVSNDGAARRLGRAIHGRGGFRRFKDQLHEQYPELPPVWYAFRDNRAKRRAVEWLHDNGLVDRNTATGFFDNHPPGFHRCGDRLVYEVRG